MATTTLDTKTPNTTSTEDLSVAGKKPRKWSSVRRKFSLIITNRPTTSPTPPDAQTADSQVEAFCRPYTQGLPPLVPVRPSTPESETEVEFRRLTKENSIRNNNIDLLPAAKPRKTSRRSKKKKKIDKVVRFIEEPDIIGHDGGEAELQQLDQESVLEESDVEFITSALEPIPAR